MQSLEFDLIVYAPYRAMEGFVSDMEVYLACQIFFSLVFCVLRLYIDETLFWYEIALL